jgi:Gpi18-like mannosyltransferase
MKRLLVYFGKTTSLYLPIIILLMFLTPKTGNSWDISCWISWARYSFQNGLKNIYKSDTDYLPLYHYILFIYGKIQGSVDGITSNIHYLKLLTLLFEFSSTLVLVKLLEEKFRNTYKSILFSLFYFLNIAFLYNCLIWGQVDGIMTFFVFASIISGYYKKLILSMICFMLALNLKIQSIIFFPIIIVILIPLIKRSYLKFLLSIIVTLIIQFLILLPFIWVGDLSKLLNVVFGSVGKYPFVSMNAYNIWYLFLDGDLMKIQDSVMFIGLSFKNWGLVLFFTASFFALYHFIKSIFLYFVKKQTIEYSLKKLLISSSLIPLLFFFLNTQMHERYSHPAFIFLTAYSLLNNRPFLLFLASLAYFLNMEDVLRFFQTNNYQTLIFTPWFIASLYLIIIIWLFIDLYEFDFKKHSRKIIDLI